MKKLVSVILPTYNRAHLLDRSIKSVLKQTYENFELIVVNDGSSDETERRVKEYQKLDKRTKYVKNDKSLGVSSARNIGIKIAKGDFIAFQDDDDEWLPLKLEKQVSALESLPQKYALCFTAFYKEEGGKKFYFPDNNLKAICQSNEKIKKKLLEGFSFIPTPSMMIKKEILFKVGFFDEKMLMWVDYDLLMRILLKKYFIQFIEEPLWHYYQTPNSLSFQGGKIYRKTKLYIFKKYFKEIKEDKKILSRWHQELGHLYMLEKEEKIAKNYFKKAIKDNPLNFYLFLQFIISLLGANFYLFFSKIKKIRKI